MTAIVYSGTNCDWCDRVVKLLRDNGEEITEIKLDSKEKIKEMNKTCGKKLNTVPQVVIDGEHIGGFTETERYINQKK
tara:strand:- start:205 stop:438 length:234 start_codon:yes stop_codon:yes gene_type:complete